MNKLLIKDKLKDFLIEDINHKDLSTQLIFSEDEVGTGYFVAKDSGIIAGLFVAQMVYDLLEGDANIVFNFKDGDFVNKGDIICKVEAKIWALLSGERIILNIMQRMSGVATMTSRAVKLLSDVNTNVVDTRKTIPGLRVFDKLAVEIGGGVNHRQGLYDGVMLKDNHIFHAGSIESAVSLVKSKVGHMVKVEVEVETFDQLRDAINSNVDVVMLDNQTPTSAKEMVELIPSTIISEISGGITLDNLESYKHCGADYISLGCLTNQNNNLDISFNLNLNKGENNG